MQSSQACFATCLLVVMSSLCFCSSSTPEKVAEDVRSKINEHVKAVEEKTSSQQQTALQVRPAQPSR
jgi:uncharacterized membrane protein